MKFPAIVVSYRPLAAALLTAGLLGGCGQYGDLYLPDEPPAEPVPAPAEPAADDEDQPEAPAPQAR